MEQQREMTYAEALAELESILGGFESGKADIDTLAAQVARATELIKFCRQRLSKVESDVKEAMKVEANANK